MKDIITGLSGWKGLIDYRPPLGPHEPWHMWFARQIRKDFDQWLESYPDVLPEMLTDYQRALMFAAFKAGYDKRADEE